MDEKTKYFLIEKIKEKKELSGITDSVVRDSLEKVLNKFAFSSNESDLKVIVSEVRKSLRRISGQYQISAKKREKLFSEKDFKEILNSHSSTRERLKIYPRIREIISKEKVSSVLDLGCGLNPLALATPKLKYFACDIKADELEIIEEFFKLKKISGNVFIYDLRKINSTLPKADLCLILKVFDILGENNHSLAKKILQTVSCKIFLVSFSTRKLSGKPMTRPERLWFERVLSQLSFEYSKINSDNEVFYLFRKSGEK